MFQVFFAQRLGQERLDDWRRTRQPRAYPDAERRPKHLKHWTNR